MSLLNQKKVIVTGGLGFIGSHLSKALVERGARVTIIDSMIPEYGGNIQNIESFKESVSVNYSDIRDTHSLKYLIQDQDYIFNLAGQVSHIDSMKNPVTDLDINCKAQLTLLDACRQYNPQVKIVFAGTRQIYGRPEYLPVDENHPIMPIDVNGINKVAGEWYHILYNKVYGIKCCSLRLTNTYGPHQLLKHNKQGFTGVFIREALLGNTIKLFGTGEQLRDFNYVSDVVNALITVAEKDTCWGEIFNLGADASHSLIDFVRILQSFCDFQYDIVPFPPEKKAIDIGDYYSSYEKIHQKTGWKPLISLETGLKKTVEYYTQYLDKYYSP